MLRTRKRFLALMLVCTAGVLLQTGLMPTSCAQYLGQAALTSFDFCSVFNCTSGTYFNLCEPIALLADCPTTTSTP